MNVLPQSSDDMRRLGQYLEGQRTSMLSFADDHGQITARPMTPLEMDAQGELWMLASRRAMTPVFVAALRQANLIFSDAERSVFISIAGVARLSDDAQRKVALWSVAARPWFPAGADDPDLVLLALQPQVADIWDGPESEVMRLLALTASLIAARPIGLGEHQIIKPPDVSHPQPAR
jgi:general stress protein 26